ncbi:MAG: molybdenum cofactor guanylyltransferase MobA [Azospirillaceae bacterium]|nr:molybdenum cofactor guanylyltransferase MobA [Azospirillaceae bacterium]
MRILGLILAGGLARRFGGSEAAAVDKPLLTLAGRPLLAHVRDRLAPQVTDMALNANGDPARYRGFDLPILPDTVAGHPGPLAGVLAGLEHAVNQGGYAYVLSVPGDCPFLPWNLAGRLATIAPRNGIACAASAGRRHPVVALWPVALAADLRHALAVEDMRRVNAFLARHPVAEADFPAVPVDPFFNVNTPEDLTAAQAFA